GKIRVSVVATGIDVEEATQATPLQAKVFAFPGGRGGSEPAKPAAKKGADPEPVTREAPKADREPEEEPVSFIDEPVEAPSELALDPPADDNDGEELLLDTPDQPEAPAEDESASRSWLSR